MVYNYNNSEIWFIENKFIEFIENQIYLLRTKGL